MTPDGFQSAVEIFETLSRELYRAYRGKRRARLREGLGRLKELVEGNTMPYVQVYLGVLDRKRQKTIKFGRVEVLYCDDGELMVLGRDAEPRTFCVGGELVVLPEDQCPVCLGDWKIDPRSPQACPECGAALGSDVKVVIENERCPFCSDERGGSSEACFCGFDWNAAWAVRR